MSAPLSVSRRAVVLGGGCMFGAASLSGRRAFAAGLQVTDVDVLTDQLLNLFPELAVYFGTPQAQNGGALARRMDDWSVSASQSLPALLSQAAKALNRPANANSVTTKAAMTTIRNGLATANIAYGRQNPLWYLGHVPYVIASGGGPHLDTPGFMINQQSLDSVAAVDAWIEKLSGFGRGFDVVCDRLRHDASVGCRPPKVLMQKSLPAIDAFLSGPVDAHPMVLALRVRTERAGIDPFIRATAERRAIEALEKIARPAYARLRVLVADLARNGSAHDGIWAQPDGKALYAANARALGDTTLSPGDIHQLGLDEVGRVGAAMDAALRVQGLSKGSVGARMAALSQEPRFTFGAGDAARGAIIDRARQLIAMAESHYPQILPADLIPHSHVEVQRVAPSAESAVPLAFADPPPIDGSGPGIFWLNLKDPASLTRLNLSTIVFHEGVPGHFTAGAVASEASQLPLFLKIASFNAFNEGWALYAEALMAELGVYQDDPWGDLGRLNDELWRAVRLVVDTGIHHQRWSRTRAIRYMMAMTGKGEAVVTTEIERYMAWPGQALGYKLGELRIRKLRQAVRAHLGAAFVLPEFHRRVLENGSVPLDVVEDRLRATGNIA